MNTININKEEPQQQQQSQAQGSSSSEESSSGGGGSVSSDNSIYSEAQSSSSVDQQYESYADQRRAEQQQERINELFGFNKDEEQETFVEEEPSYEEVEAEKEAQEKEQAKADEKKAAEAEKAAKKEADKKVEDAKYEAERTTKKATEKAVDEAKAEAKHEVEKYKYENGYDDDMHLSSREALNRMGASSVYDGEGVLNYYDTMACAAEDLTHNDQWKISMDTDGDGKMEDVNLADAIADSFDSELDLYIQEEVDAVMKKYGTCSKQYLSDEAITELATKGIRVDAVGGEDQMTNRTYSFSLIDVPEDIRKLMNKDNLTAEEKQKIKDAVYADDAKVMEDKNGKKGSFIFADCLIPDGYAQGAEFNLSSILDQMGYDCISKADFIGNEDEYWRVINEVKNGVQNGEYGSSVGMNEIYGNLKEIRTAVTNLWGGDGSAPGQHVYGLHGEGGVDGSGKTELEKQKEEQQKAKELENDIKAYRQKLLDQKVAQYKKENNDETPSRATMDEFEKEVDIKVKAKFGVKAAA